MPKSLLPLPPPPPPPREIYSLGKQSLCAYVVLTAKQGVCKFEMLKFCVFFLRANFVFRRRRRRRIQSQSPDSDGRARKKKAGPQEMAAFATFRAFEAEEEEKEEKPKLSEMEPKMEPEKKASPLPLVPKRRSLRESDAAQKKSENYRGPTPRLPDIGPSDFLLFAREEKMRESAGAEKASDGSLPAFLSSPC